METQQRRGNDLSKSKLRSWSLGTCFVYGTVCALPAIAAFYTYKWAKGISSSSSSSTSSSSTSSNSTSSSNTSSSSNSSSNNSSSSSSNSSKEDTNSVSDQKLSIFGSHVLIGLLRHAKSIKQQKAIFTLIQNIEYQFNRNQLLSDISAVASIFKSLTHLETAFGTKSLSNILRDNQHSLAPRDKHDFFNQIKICCFSKFIAALYLLLLRCWIYRIEIYIIARHAIPQLMLSVESIPDSVVQLLLHVGEGETEPCVFIESVFSKLISANDGAFCSKAFEAKSLWSEAAPVVATATATATATAAAAAGDSLSNRLVGEHSYHRPSCVFLTSLQWFESQRVLNQWFDMVKNVVEFVLSDVFPQNSVNLSDVESLITKVCARIETEFFKQERHINTNMVSNIQDEAEYSVLPQNIVYSPLLLPPPTTAAAAEVEQVAAERMRRYHNALHLQQQQQQQKQQSNLLCELLLPPLPVIDNTDEAASNSEAGTAAESQDDTSNEEINSNEANGELRGSETVEGTEADGKTLKNDNAAAVDGFLTFQVSNSSQRLTKHEEKFVQMCLLETKAVILSEKFKFCFQESRQLLLRVAIQIINNRRLLLVNSSPSSGLAAATATAVATANPSNSSSSFPLCRVFGALSGAASLLLSYSSSAVTASQSVKDNVNNEFAVLFSKLKCVQSLCSYIFWPSNFHYNVLLSVSSSNLPTRSTSAAPTALTAAAALAAPAADLLLKQFV